MVKINNECKNECFDKLNVKTAIKPFWKTCKPYLSKKHSHGGFKITLIGSVIIVSENQKIAKTFNTNFELVTDPLNLFEWIGGYLKGERNKSTLFVLNVFLVELRSLQGNLFKFLSPLKSCCALYSLTKNIFNLTRRFWKNVQL